MAITKSAITVLASVSATAGGTKTSPGATGAAIDCRTYYGGELTYKLVNSASAPGILPTLLFQVSQDGTTWFDYYSAFGDTVSSSISTGSIQLDRGVMYLRVIVYGNTTNAVTAEAGLQAITGI